jgi:hypothetical protein
MARTMAMKMSSSLRASASTPGAHDANRDPPPDSAVQVSHRRLQAQPVPVDRDHGALNLVPGRISVPVLVKHRERRLSGLEVGEEPGNVGNGDVVGSGLTERVEQPSREGFALVERGECSGDPVAGRVGLEDTLSCHLARDVAESGSGGLGNLAKAAESLAKSNLGDLRSFGLCRLSICQRVGPTRDVTRVDVERREASDLELLLLEAVLVGVLVKLQRGWRWWSSWCAMWRTGRRCSC